MDNGSDKRASTENKIALIASGLTIVLRPREDTVLKGSRYRLKEVTEKKEWLTDGAWISQKSPAHSLRYVEELLETWREICENV